MFEITSYQKRCKDTLGGVLEFYIAPYEKWTRSQIDVLDMDLTSMPETDFYLFQTIGSFNQNSEVENGSVFFSQNVEMKLPKVYNTYNVLNLTKQYYRVIAKTNNDDYIIFGLYNGLEGKINNASGASKSEFNGFSLNFTGKEKDMGYFISDLTSAGITVVDNDLLESDLNIDL